MITVVTLDDFDRPDSSTLGPDWMPINTLATGSLRLGIKDGGAHNNTAGILSEFWVPDTFGPDVEVQLELRTNLGSGNVFDLYARLIWPEETPPEEWNPAFTYAMSDFYRARFQSDVVTIYADTVIGSNEFVPFMDPDGGGAVALRCEGNTITALMRVDATADWETIVSVEDTTWPDAGYVGFGFLSVQNGPVAGTAAGDEPAAPPATLAAWGILAR